MLKAVIAGCGLIATKNHIPAFMKLKDKAEIVAVCDLDENAVKKTANEFGIPKYYTNFSDMIITEKPDIVDICTPPQTHAKLAKEAVEKGCHVLLEKPMALKSEDCDAMVEASLKHKKHICVMHNQIFNPAFIRAKELFSKGKIGDFLGMRIVLSTPTDYITSKKDHWAHKLPGGILGETGPHIVYMALAFLKNVYDVKITARKFIPEYNWSNAEDFRIDIIAENGISSNTLSYGSSQWEASVDISGTKGTLKIDLESQSVITCKRAGLKASTVGLSVLSQITQTLKEMLYTTFRFMIRKDCNAHEVGIRKFTESIIKGKNPPVTAEDGRETIRIMEMMVERLNSIRM